jgi:hypothetical protein
VTPNTDFTPLTVALPLGIGDCYWAAQKLRALKALHGERPLYCFLNESTSHATTPLLGMMSFVDRAEYHPVAPGNLWKDIENHRAPKWSDLESCRGWKGFDYLVCPNGHLERGERIETFFPELATEYEIPLTFPEGTLEWLDGSVGRGRVLLYLSGKGPNAGFHANTWTVEHWTAVVRLLNTEGIEPVFVGAPTKDDLGYGKWVTSRCLREGLSFTDGIGCTTIPQYIALMQHASVWAGLNSGGGIVSASMRTPTVMLWSDLAHKIEGVHERVYLHSNMQRAWLNNEQQRDYRTLSYGAPGTTPERLVALMLEVKR